MINNGDGTVTCYFDSLGHVAFLVPSDAPTDVPTTGDNSTENNIVLWVSVMAVSLCGLIVLAVVARRRKADEE